MPPKRKRQTRGDLQAYLRALGVKARFFMPIIDRAIRQAWSTDRLLMEVRTSRPFRRMFPGIPDDMTPAQYRQVEREYVDVARDFGIKMNRKRKGLLFRGNVSPEEWYNRANIFKTVQTTENIRNAFNQVIGRTGRRQLNKQGWFAFLNRKADAKLYDLYEAASLRASGLDMTVREARQAARQIGQVGEFVDVGQLVQQVRAIKDVAEPELQREGITDADLAVLESGQDPKGITQTLERIVNARRALETGVREPGRGRTEFGQPLLFAGEEEGL